MTSFLPHQILQNTFLLSANRTVFWEEEKVLILSDLHIGKSGHFRKNGIAIPQNIIKEDLVKLHAEIQYFKPKQIIIVGDLFHSTANKEHELFAAWRNNIGNIGVHLVKGNHDILNENWYAAENILTHKKHFAIGNFTFTHDVNECEENNQNYCFSGHIHPSILMRGLGRQALNLPCFYFSKTYAVLPAYGKFTGTYQIKPTKEDAVFVLVENKIMKI